MENEQKQVEAEVKTDDVNQVVSETDVNTQVVNELSEITPPATEEKGAVPYDRFNEVNTAKNQAEERAIAAEKARQDTETRMALLQQQILAGQQMNSQQVQPPKQNDYYSRLGLNDDDIPNVEQQRQINAMMQHDFAIAMQTQQFLARNADFNDVVGKVNPVTGQLETSKYLKQVMEETPELRGIDALAMQNPAIATMAHKMAVQRKLIEELSTKTNASDEFLKNKAISDKTSVVSSQAAGGGSGTDYQSKIANLDPNSPEFDAVIRRIRSGEFDRQ